MLKLLFTTFWPVLIPSLVYLLWRLTRGASAKFSHAKKDEDGNVIIDAEEVTDEKSWVKTPLFWVFFASITLLIICFLWLGIAEPRDTEGTYIPPYTKDGEIHGGYTE